jgi:CheY-like chemotaxis protein
MIDQEMPEMDGLTLARTIRSENTATKLALLTNFGSRIGDEELKGAGITACRFKPSRQSTLLAWLLPLLSPTN